MRYEIRSIGIWSVIKVLFFLNGFAGFAAGFVMAVFTALALTISGAVFLQEFNVDSAEMSLGFLFILYPVIGAIGGSVFGTFVSLVAVMFYNLLSRLVGGIEIDIALTDNKKQSENVAPLPQTKTTTTAQTAKQTLPPLPSAHRNMPIHQDDPVQQVEPAHQDKPVQPPKPDMPIEKVEPLDDKRVDKDNRE